jgi:hypothetical protein
MGAASDPRIREYAEANRTFFTIFYDLRQQILQSDFILWSDADSSWLGIDLIVRSPQLLQVV